MYEYNIMFHLLSDIFIALEVKVKKSSPASIIFDVKKEGRLRRALKRVLVLLLCCSVSNNNLRINKLRII